MAPGRPRIQNIDLDQDGKISREEYEAAWEKYHKEQFDRLDVNKDGSLSADELPPRFAPVAP
jgi:Ca2+-binding EF-hand superfamily protein